jgi:hypothetical protein
MIYKVRPASGEAGKEGKLHGFCKLKWFSGAGGVARVKVV